MTAENVNNFARAAQATTQTASSPPQQLFCGATPGPGTRSVSTNTSYDGGPLAAAAAAAAAAPDQIVSAVDVILHTRTDLLRKYPDFRAAYNSLLPNERAAFDAAFDEAHADVVRSITARRGGRRRSVMRRSASQQGSEGGGGDENEPLGLPADPAPPLTSTPASLRDHQHSALQRTLENCLANGLFRAGSARSKSPLPEISNVSRDEPDLQEPSTFDKSTDPGSFRRDREPADAVTSIRRERPPPSRLARAASPGAAAPPSSTASRPPHALMEKPFAQVLVEAPDAVAALMRDPSVSAMFEDWWVTADADASPLPFTSPSASSPPPRRREPGQRPPFVGQHGDGGTPSAVRRPSVGAVIPRATSKARDPRMRYLAWVWGEERARSGTPALQGVAENVPTTNRRRETHQAVAAGVLETLPTPRAEDAAESAEWF